MHVHARRNWLLSLVLLAACAYEAGPGPEPEPERPISNAIVSASVVQPVGGNGSSLVAAQSFVSMEPGTYPTGYYVELKNLRTKVVSRGRMLNGGFDPMGIEAEALDTLAVKVFNATREPRITYAVVPIRSKPRVVRTSPSNRKTDVPLNKVIVVVFNQPMDSTSVIRAAQLQRVGSGTQPGTIWLAGPGEFVVRSNFTPDSLLAPQTTYQFTISTDARSSEGEPLEEAVSIEFTTGNLTEFARLRVVHGAPGVGDMDIYADGELSVRGLKYPGATGYMTVTAARHEFWFETPLGRMDEWQKPLAPGEYTALPCCAGFPLGGWTIEDDNSEPPLGQARIRVVAMTTLSPMQFYLTTAGTDTTGVTPIPVDGGTWVSEYIEVPPGSYQIRAASSTNDPIDSGTLTLLAGQVRTLVSVGDGSNASPFAFLILQDRD